MKFDLEKFKLARKQQKLTLNEIGNLIGVSRSTMNAWSIGKRIPSEANVRMLARVLNTTEDFFSDLEPSAEISTSNLSKATSEWTRTGATSEQQDSELGIIYSQLVSLGNKLNNTNMVKNAVSSSIDTMFYIKNYDLEYIIANHGFFEKFISST